MSALLVGFALRTGIPTPEKILLVAMANYASDNGQNVYAGIDNYARLTSYGPRNVRRKLRVLEASGLIEPIRYAAGGRGKSTEYVINATLLETVSKAPPSVVEEMIADARRRVEDKGGQPDPHTTTPNPDILDANPDQAVHKPGHPGPPISENQIDHSRARDETVEAAGDLTAAASTLTAPLFRDLPRRDGEGWAAYFKRAALENHNEPTEDRNGD